MWSRRLRFHLVPGPNPDPIRSFNPNLNPRNPNLGPNPWARQHKNGFEGALDPWCRALWSSLRERCPLPPNVEEPDDADDTVPPLGEPKFTVRQTAAGGAGGDCRTLAQAAALMDQVRVQAAAASLAVPNPHPNTLP